MLKFSGGIAACDHTDYGNPPPWGKKGELSFMKKKVKIGGQFAIETENVPMAGNIVENNKTEYGLQK